MCTRNQRPSCCGSPAGRRENEERSICVHKNSSGCNVPRASLCASNVYLNPYSMDTACISWNPDATTRLHLFSDIKDANSCPAIPSYAPHGVHGVFLSFYV